MLSAAQVVKNYTGKRALDGVSITAKPGRIFGLLGPNGAGKTTLIRIITRITMPDSGTVMWKGAPLRKNHNEILGYLPEERGLYKKMSVADQGEYFGGLKNMGRREAREKLNFWLKKLEMETWRDKNAEELSKGMQQKVQFVLCILHNPDLIILDEPFTGFDPVNADIIRNEIINLKNEGKTILLSTHRMESVEQMCDDIALINGGKVILDGEVSEVKRKFKPMLVKVRFQGSIPEIPAGYSVVKALDKGEEKELIFSFSNPNQKHGSLLNAFAQQTELLHFEELMADMEGIFIQMTKGSEGGAHE